MSIHKIFIRSHLKIDIFNISFHPFVQFLFIASNVCVFLWEFPWHECNLDRDGRLFTCRWSSRFLVLFWYKWVLLFFRVICQQKEHNPLLHLECVNCCHVLFQFAYVIMRHTLLAIHDFILLLQKENLLNQNLLNKILVYCNFFSKKHVSLRKVNDIYSDRHQSWALFRRWVSLYDFAWQCFIWCVTGKNVWFIRTLIWISVCWL